MRFCLLSTALLIAQWCCSPTAAYMQQRPIENAPGPEDISNARGARGGSCDNKADAPIPLETEPSRADRRLVNKKNASSCEGECVNGEDTDRNAVIADIR